MGETPTTRRFHVNPVEVAIFSIVALIFANSVYNLFYDRQSLRSDSLTAMSANPTSEGRALASTPQSFINVDMKCDAGPAITRDTSASKIRLTGPLCGSLEKGESAKLLKTQITNNSNRYAATVFTDLGTGKYSTDYIPLNTGKNIIHVEFTYQGGKSVAQELNITKF